jgi:pimeloyl-ACP methyl ester carboxylesterase
MLFLHVWGGNREIQSGVLDQLRQAGCYVLNFNQRGFGESTGKRSLAKWGQGTSILANYLIDKGFKLWICGLSTGGAMSIDAMTLNQRIKGGNIMSPFASIDQLFKDKPELKDGLRSILGPFTDDTSRPQRSSCHYSRS